MDSKTALKSIGLLMMLVLTGCASWPGDSASIARPDPNSPRAFSFQRDTFAFANETVWQYKDGKPVQSVPDKTDPEGEGYIHHCFVMSRAALQFWKFARFEPNAPKLSRAELAERVRLIARRAAWRDALPPAERVVLPGYRDLRQFSATEGGLLRENLGASWPTYFRLGNWRIVLPVSDTYEARTAEGLDASLAAGRPAVLWLYQFPELTINHAVLAYRRLPGAEPRYLVVDPNYTDRPRTLRFDPRRRIFEYEPTFYFPGGPVTVRPVYLSAVQ